MAKKEVFIVKKTEDVNLNFYAVRSQDGKWFRSKGQHGYGNSWVDDISEAKCYSSPGPAKSQITFWSKKYPEFGIPDLVRITTGVCEYLEQTEQVKERIVKIEQNKIKDEIRKAEYRINNYLINTKIERDYIDGQKEKIKDLKEKLKNLK